MNNGKVTENYCLDNLVNADILEKGKKLLIQGFKIRPKDNKIVPVVPAKAFNVPWIYVLSDESKDCGFWHQIIFDTYGLFPIGCLNCWKVVVRPRTVKELFQLHEYQDDIYKNWREGKGFCKCGIEARNYVHGNYGGYFYNNTLEDGLESYEKVRSDIDKYISKNVPVILKRACTEYELKYGDSSQWEEILEKGQYTDKEKNTIVMPTIDIIEEKVSILKDHIETQTEEQLEHAEGCNVMQPPYVKIAVMRMWLERAYDVGDSTALEFNEGGKPFYTPSETYHNKNLTTEDFDKFRKFVKEVSHK